MKITNYAKLLSDDCGVPEETILTVLKTMATLVEKSHRANAPARIPGMGIVVPYREGIKMVAVDA